MSLLRRAYSIFRKSPVTDEAILAKIVDIRQLTMNLKKFHDDINPNQETIRDRSLISSMLSDPVYSAAKEQLISALKDLGIYGSKLEEIKFPPDTTRFDPYYELGGIRSKKEYTGDRNIVKFVLETLLPKYATPDRTSTDSTPPSPAPGKHTPKA